MKHGIAHKNEIEIDSRQPTFNFLVEITKTFIWVVKPICFATKFGVATHGLRILALDETKLVLPTTQAW